MGWRSAFRGVLTSDDDYEALRERVVAGRSAGCVPVASLPLRRRAKVAGILRSVVLRPREGVPTVEAELFDGSGVLDLVWLGRRSIKGIEPGRRLGVEGMICEAHGRRTIYNPRYELRPRAGDL
ncbi:OB-fold nucleic acid binding domain-containing protein [Myceligenerans crystallogenes]|uniref:OB-fold nucleic acid binding domain-containing protein n=1 Tax=Myceligenerans crystallogenes TaxID=316335 RepID=A0ABP4ZU21_9MICO